MFLCRRACFSSSKRLLNLSGLRKPTRSSLSSTHTPPLNNTKTTLHSRSIHSPLVFSKKSADVGFHRISTRKFSNCSHKFTSTLTSLIAAKSCSSFRLPASLIQMASTASTGSLWGWSWRPTSPEKLLASETAMLSCLKTPFELTMLELPNGEKINTLKMGQGPPLVFLHGFGGGLALFAANLEHLAKNFTVYAIDLPGFGRSSRPQFSGTTSTDAESYFINELNSWMDTLNLQNAIIMGHSLGAYISAVWALNHPQRFERLVLVDPFGIPKKPIDSGKNISKGIKLIAGVVRAVSSSPMSLLRAAGPWGPGLIKRLRPDLVEKFSHLHPNNTEVISDYIYHINAQSPATGELAFQRILTGFGYAEDPLIDRLGNLDKNVPVSFIYGSDSWMNPLHGVQLKESMVDHQTDFCIVPDAGHHVYIDNYHHFNYVAVLAAKGELGRNTHRQYLRILEEYKKKQQQQSPVISSSSSEATNA